jgi:DNA-binding transcriptional regulator YiaG
MTSVFSHLNEHIRKLARRELKPLLTEAKKRTSEHRRAIALLKREVAALKRDLAVARQHAPKEPAISPQVLQKSRLRIDGLKAHRQKLGLSAREYGRLMGVSGLTIYNWEAGKSKPRRTQLPRIVSVRGIGKREALNRLNEDKT